MASDNLKNIKSEKAKAVRRFKKMQMISATFRLFEFCMFLITLCSFTTRLNFAASKLSEVFSRGLYTTLLSPRFVFLIGNAIFIVLFLQSGHSSQKHEKYDFYEEYTEQPRKNRDFIYEYEDVRKQGKQSYSVLEQSNSVSEQSNSVSEQSNSVSEQSNSVSEQRNSVSGKYYSKEKKMQRSQSEKRVNIKERELRRSETTVSRRKTDSRAHRSTEEMSSEDFKRRVEDFIARQQRALREEEFSFFHSE